MGRRQQLGRVAGVLAAAALALVGTAGPASAAVDEGNGHEIKPGQPFGGTTPAREWVGSYLVGGDQVFCVLYQYKAPDSEEKYQVGDELKDKWGRSLSEEVAANISYLLLRYGDTKDNDEAAALAHLLHTWTSPARGPEDLNPANDFRKIAYDTDFHLGKLPAGTKTAIDKLKEDAEANRGPWTASMATPKGDQTIGEAATWTVTVKNAKDKGVSDVPVKLALTDATVDGKDSASVKTGKDGTATVTVTSTGDNPKVVATLSGPADKPYVREPVNPGNPPVQRVVSTGGEKELTAQGTVGAKAKPTPTPTPEVPRTIPAGDQANAMVRGDTSAGPSLGALAAVGGLAALGSLLVGLTARRRWGKR